MQKLSKLIILFVLVLSTSLILIVGCNEETIADNEGDVEESLEGTYVGYSWQNETDGVELEEAERKIETILTLDEDGIIEDAKMRYWQKYDNYWGTRNDGSAGVWVDFNEEPTMADFNEDGEFELGNSIFKISTNNMNSFWAVAVDEDTGQTAAAIVDPWYRFQYEMMFDDDFDFENTTVGEELTIGNGLIPTVRAARDEEPDWDNYADNTIFDMTTWNHVITARGTFEGMDEDSTVQEFLEAMGVEFEDGSPIPMDVEYGYHSLGGWDGNYEAVEDYLIGQDATEFTNLYDPDDVLAGQEKPLSESINENNEFGIDVPSGATQNVQDSFDTVSGATVRMSREATSYQRALVAAGILDEEDVIIGRF